jgi:hypothetical protein
MHYTLDRALTTEGHMEPEELEWLADQASRRKSIIEWGCYLGRSTIAMAQNTTGHVWALDNFEGPADDGINTNLRPLAPGEVWDTFHKNTHDLPNITAIMFDHRSWSLLPLMADMVFIDGSHQTAHVWQDIYRFYMLPPRALLCGHDITFPTVKEAVEDLLPGYGVVPGTTIWYRRPY